MQPINNYSFAGFINYNLKFGVVQSENPSQHILWVWPLVMFLKFDQNGDNSVIYHFEVTFI